jgi:hypothetical protein
MTKRFPLSLALAAASAFALFLAVPAHACDGDCHSAKKATTTAAAEPAKSAPSTGQPAPSTASGKCECEKGGKNCTCPKGECDCANCGKGKKDA